MSNIVGCGCGSGPKQKKTGSSRTFKHYEALILGVGGGTGGRGSGCVNGDLLGGGSMSSGSGFRSSLLSIS